MKLQAHLPTVSIGARDWRAAMIASVSLFGAAVLVLALQSGILFDNRLFERLDMSPVTRPHIRVAHGVSLDLHLLSYPTNRWRRFSVAHPLPAGVASSQLLSIGLDDRLAFEIFGDAALRDMLAGERTMHQLKPHNDRLMLMLMLLRLDKHRL
jgi:hypothetical protein